MALVSVQSPFIREGGFKTAPILGHSKYDCMRKSGGGAAGVDQIIVLFTL